MAPSASIPRWLWGAVVALFLALPPPAVAGVIGGQVRSLLGKASDKALARLAEPGAFMADDKVRIAMPGGVAQRSELVRLADQAGLTNSLVQSMNTAAELAAAQARPLFRDAIEQMAIRNSLDIVGEDEAATRYLRKYAYGEIRARLRPLVMVALDSTGAFSQMGKVAATASLPRAAGLSREGLTDSVTDQALDGMFKYIADEEEALREDPISAVFKGF